MYTNTQQNTNVPPKQAVRAFVYLHNPLDVTMAFSEVNVTEFSCTFPVLDVGFEHGARTFSLSPDHTSHRVLKQTISVISGFSLTTACNMFHRFLSKDNKEKEVETIWPRLAQITTSPRNGVYILLIFLITL